jgi:hypothetical protein
MNHDEIESRGNKIIGIAIDIHKELGPALSVSNRSLHPRST